MTKLQIKQDRSLTYRWSLRRGNSKILAASSEGFSNRYGARRNFRRTRNAMNQVTEAQIDRAGR